MSDSWYTDHAPAVQHSERSACIIPSSTKSVEGCGILRKKTVAKNGKDFTCREARYTVGYDPGTGKQIQKSITGKTQREVAKKLKEMTAALQKNVTNLTK